MAPPLETFSGKCMRCPYHSARHVVGALPICLPVILKSCPLGGLLNRKIEALNPNGLSVHGDSPLAPSAQDGLQAEQVGVELSGNWCSAMPPGHMVCLQDCGHTCLAFLLLGRSSLTDSHLILRINTFFQMSLTPTGAGVRMECQGLMLLLCATV